LGAHVIDADLIAHELLACGTGIYRKIVEEFGQEVLCDDGAIDRRSLGEIVFSDPEKRFLLDNLTHPTIGREIEQRISELRRTFDRNIVIIEAALMVEVDSYKRYHSLIVVACSPSIQLSRLVDRDDLTLEEAKARIQSQLPMEEKLKLADYSINTSGTLKETHSQVEDIYKNLLELETQRSESSV